MPWEVTGPVKERTRFIETYLTGLYTLSEFAERFGVSRQKLHKCLRDTTPTPGRISFTPKLGNL